MSIRSENVKAWRKRTKRRIIEAFGGKCCCCNYNTCDSALELHHLDPKAKEFSLGGARALCIGWQRLVRELRKCILVCSNCHKEIHSNIRKLPNSLIKFNEKFSNYQELIRHDRNEDLLDECPNCKKKKYKIQKTCSRSCSAKMLYHINWEKYDLYNLKYIQKLTNTKIAELIGCSDTTILKKIRKLKVNTLL